VDEWWLYENGLLDEGPFLYDPERSRRVDDALKRSLADVIRADERVAMDDDDFDDVVWLSLVGHVGSPNDLRGMPVGVRMYFATRLFEWEIWNGGFSQALEVAGDYLDEVVAGYKILGDDESIAIVRRAQHVAQDEDALDALDNELDGPPWYGVPWSDEKRVRYVRAHRDEFRIQPRAYRSTDYEVPPQWRPARTRVPMRSRRGAEWCSDSTPEFSRPEHSERPLRAAGARCRTELAKQVDGFPQDRRVEVPLSRIRTVNRLAAAVAPPGSSGDVDHLLQGRDAGEVVDHAGDEPSELLFDLVVALFLSPQDP